MKRPDEETHKSGEILCRYKKSAHEKRGPAAEKGFLFPRQSVRFAYSYVHTEKATSARDV